jgi:multidrug efflux pump subunit AcrB
MDVTRFALEKRVITSVAIILILVGGAEAYRSLPRAEDPGFEIRQAQVITHFPGASPERVEQLVTDKIEKKIQEIPELDYVTSKSKTGISIIIVSIQERYTGMRPFWDNLRRKVQDVRSDLPDGVVGPFVNDEFGDVFGIILTLTGDGYSYAELKEVADEIRDELLRLDDVAKVDIYGAQEERIFIEYNNARLADLGLSPMQLRSLLEGRNIIISGGQVTIGPSDIAVEPSGSFETVEDLRRSVISVPGQNELVYLEDIATVTRGYIDPPRTKMHCSGASCLGLAISMRQGGNIIDLGKAVKPLLVRLQSQYPVGIELGVVAFQPDIVEGKVNDFVGNVLQSIVIVLLVMLVMLGLRTGLVVASLIPTTMVLALLVMSFFEIGLDQMSLASLIIALGMLVDNAIVMSESIMVQMAAGKPAPEAAISSARELRIPLLTSSLTTAAAFLPIYLAESTTGEYTAPLFKVVTITLLSSWVLALTMTPLLCVTFLRVTAEPEASSYNSRFYRLYRRFLLGILRQPVITLGVTGLILMAALLGMNRLPVVFFPTSDKAIFTAELELPIGTSVERSEEMVTEIERFIADELAVSESRPEGVTNWAAFIGQGAPRFQLAYGPEPPSSNYSFLLLNTTSRETLADLIPRLEAFCLERFPDLEATIEPLALGAPVDAPVQVRISGQDTDRLFQRVDDVKAHLSGIAGTKSTNDNWGARTKKIFVRIDPERARLSGVSNQDIAISLQTAMSGIETTEFREEDEVIPVLLRSVAADRQDVGKLESLNVYSQTTGRSVPLKQVADIEVQWEPSVIRRRNRLRTVTVDSQVLPGVTATDVTTELVPWLDEQSMEWGVGYYYELGGEAETSGKANQSIVDKLPVAGLIIVLLLVGQFNSIRRPLIILLTIPLALIGVTIGLTITNQYIGFMPFLGIISLAGIVINNAIVLLDRIQLEIEENGHEPPRAVIEAAQRRLRPILLTTATTVGGLLPLWFGGGPLWEAMAIAIIFGLLFATVLTLGVVPVLYSLFFGVRFKKLSYE